MTSIRMIVIAIVTLGLCAGNAFAAAPAAGPQDVNLRILLDTIRANRKALVSVNLQLTPEESEKFWPVYDKYQAEIAATGDRAAALIEEYTGNFATLSNERALELVQSYLAAEADRIKIRQTYMAEFAKILPGRTVARLFQIENKIDAVVRYDLASTIPVIDEAPAAK